MKKSHDGHKKYWWSILLVLVVLIFIFFRGALAPRRQNEQKATLLAEKYAHITKKVNYYEYRREGKEYHTVEGTNKQGEKVYAVISSNNRKINVFAASRGRSAKQVIQLIKRQKRPHKILHLALGMNKHGKTPVWEVTYLNQAGNLCYAIVSFKSGTIIKEIQNLG